MPEKELLTPDEIVSRTKKVIDGVLAEGDWEHSVFLKVEAAKLRLLCDELGKLVRYKGQGLGSEFVVNKTSDRRAVSPGWSQVFILLYQANDTDLYSWYRTIKTLTEHSVSRPAYKDESHAQEFIRSKTAGVEHNGYAVVNVKDEDFYDAEAAPVDAYGHQLFVLKENSVKLENIVEFVHANKKHYAIHDNELILLDEEPPV
ncbi:MAG: IcmQ [uncultured bacterium]|nr:MAG: IcmQ [uncultured bacterium]